MKFLILFVAAIAMSAEVSQAKSITCLSAIITGNDIIAADRNSDNNGYGWEMTFDDNKDSEHKISYKGKNYTVYVSSITDSDVDLTEVSLSYFEGETRLAKASALLKYSGEVDSDDWQYGPEGTDKLVQIRGGLESIPTMASVNSKVYKTLKPYGLKSAIVYNQSYPIDMAALQAMDNDELDPNDPVYFIFNYLNCYRK